MPAVPVPVLRPELIFVHMLQGQALLTEGQDCLSPQVPSLPPCRGCPFSQGYGYCHPCCCCLCYSCHHCHWPNVPQHPRSGPHGAPDCPRCACICQAAWPTAQHAHHLPCPQALLTATQCISSAHVYAPLSQWTILTRHRFKDKIIKNVKTMTGEH